MGSNNSTFPADIRNHNVHHIVNNNVPSHLLSNTFDLIQAPPVIPSVIPSVNGLYYNPYSVYEDDKNTQHFILPCSLLMSDTSNHISYNIKTNELSFSLSSSSSECKYVLFYHVLATMIKNNSDQINPSYLDLLHNAINKSDFTDKHKYIKINKCGILLNRATMTQNELPRYSKDKIEKSTEFKKISTIMPDNFIHDINQNLEKIKMFGGDNNTNFMNSPSYFPVILAIFGRVDTKRGDNQYQEDMQLDQSIMNNSIISKNNNLYITEYHMFHIDISTITDDIVQFNRKYHIIHDKKEDQLFSIEKVAGMDYNTPISNTNNGIVSNTNITDDNSFDSECIICFGNKKDTVVIPCKHLSMCYPCAKLIYNTKKECPVCRENIDQLVFIPSN